MPKRVQFDIDEEVWSLLVQEAKENEREPQRHARYILNTHLKKQSLPTYTREKGAPYQP